MTETDKCKGNAFGVFKQNTIVLKKITPEIGVVLTTNIYKFKEQQYISEKGKNRLINNLKMR